MADIITEEDLLFLEEEDVDDLPASSGEIVLNNNVRGSIATPGFPLLSGLGSNLSQGFSPISTIGGPLANPISTIPGFSGLPQGFSGLPPGLGPPQAFSGLPPGLGSGLTLPPGLGSGLGPPPTSIRSFGDFYDEEPEDIPFNNIDNVDLNPGTSERDALTITLQDPEQPYTKIDVKRLTDEEEPDIISIILAAIDSREEDIVARAVSQLPLTAPISELPDERDYTNPEDMSLLDITLQALLIYCFDTDTKISIVKVIMDIWEETNPLDNYQTISRIFTFPSLDASHLGYVVQYFPRVGFLEIAEELARQDGGQDNGTAFLKLVDVFKPNRQQLETLLEYLSIQRDMYQQWNQGIMDVLPAAIEKLSPYAPMPTYISNFSMVPKVILDRATQEVNKAPGVNTVRQATVEITSGLSQEGVDPETLENIRARVQDALETQYAGSSDNRESFYDIITEANKQKVRLSQDTDRDLTRILGPCNRIVDMKLEGNDYICTHFGGCRMLSCECFRDDDIGDFYGEEDDIYYNGWFTGTCSACLNKIAKKVYAVRIPKPAGGWIGCYCSWKCTEKDITEELKIVPRMIKIVQKEIESVGIQDYDNLGWSS